MDNAQLSLTSYMRQQAGSEEREEYAEGNNYFGKQLHLTMIYVLACGSSLMHLVSESNAIPVDQFQNYIQKKDILIRQFKV